MNYQKWVNVALLAAGGVVFLFVRQFFEGLWFLAKAPVLEGWPIAPYDLAAFLLSFGGAIWVRRLERANLFLNEVAQELVKVTWPNKKETVLSTSVVLVMVGACTLVLFLIDILWGTISRGVTAG